MMIDRNPECVHWEGQNNETPLFYATYYKHFKAAEKLLKHGADPNVK